MAEIKENVICQRLFLWMNKKNYNWVGVKYDAMYHREVALRLVFPFSVNFIQ